MLPAGRRTVPAGRFGALLLTDSETAIPALSALARANPLAHTVRGPGIRIARRGGQSSFRPGRPASGCPIKCFCYTGNIEI